MYHMWIICVLFFRLNFLNEWLVFNCVHSKVTNSGLPITTGKPFQQKVRPWPSEKKVSCHLHPEGETPWRSRDGCVELARRTWIMCPGGQRGSQNNKKICQNTRFLLDVEAEHYPLKRISKKHKPLPNLLCLRGSMLSPCYVSPWFDNRNLANVPVKLSRQPSTPSNKILE